MAKEQNQPDVTTREGFAEASSPLSRLLLTVSYGVLHNWDAAADAVQSALLKAWRYRHSVKGPESFKAWLVKIALNESKNMARRGFDLELQENVPQREGDRELKMDVMGAVFQLPEKYRLPVMMFYFEGMSVVDIAQALDLPLGTVTSRLHRSRELLREELKDYGK